MNNTLRLLQPFIDDDLQSFSLEVLAEMYQKCDKTTILATSFEKIYRLAILVSSEFWGLNEDDLASWCLEKLDVCLRTYNSETKFTTYFSTVYRNKLREETERLNYKKRKCILESINDIIDIGLEDTYNLLDMMLPNTLSDKEYKYCILAAEGYDNDYIAKQMNVSRMTICNIRKSLKIKCATLQD